MIMNKMCTFNSYILEIYLSSYCVIDAKLVW